MFVSKRVRENLEQVSLQIESTGNLRRGRKLISSHTVKPIDFVGTDKTIRMTRKFSLHDFIDRDNGS
jgi:hypothetical protein